MTGSRLAALLNQATPGPWEFNDSTDPRGHKGEFRAPSPYNGFMLVGPWTNGHDARLIALAPDMARLLVDMADEVSRHPRGEHHHIINAFTGEMDGTCRICERNALLARFAEIERRAAQ